MTFIDPFTSWSLVHFAGSFILTLALGSANLHISPMASGGLVFSAGIGWELTADQQFRDDPRGGDYYDLMWDLGGCLAGSALLESGQHFRQRHPLNSSEFHFYPPTPQNGFHSDWALWYNHRKKPLAQNFLSHGLSDSIEGRHEVTFDGSRLASGVYFTLFQTDNANQVQKMVLMK